MPVRKNIETRYIVSHHNVKHMDSFCYILLTVKLPLCYYVVSKIALENNYVYHL
jgi:hypothetical protein